MLIVSSDSLDPSHTTLKEWRIPTTGAKGADCLFIDRSITC